MNACAFGLDNTTFGMVQIQNIAHDRATSPLDSVANSRSIPFPPEIFDAIISQAKDNRSLLAKCGLVCRNWVPASRHHFLKRRLIRLHPGNADKLRELLQSPHSTLARHIYRIKIDAIALKSETEADVRTTSPSLFASTEVLEVLSTGTPIEPIHGQKIHQKFPNLTTLVFSTTTFVSLESLIGITCSSPHLKNLKLIHVSGLQLNGAYYHEEPGSQRLPPRLTSVCIDGTSSIIDLLTWFLSCTSPPPIQSLRFRPMKRVDDDSNSINQLLRNLGPSLEKLHINEYVSQAMETIDLSCNTELRSLVVECITREIEAIRTGWLDTLVSTISSSCVEKFDICIYNCHRLAENLEALPLEEFDRLLNHPRFSRLRQVAFFIPNSTSATKKMIEERMSSCHSRGVLSLSLFRPE